MPTPTLRSAAAWTRRTRMAFDASGAFSTFAACTALVGLPAHSAPVSYLAGTVAQTSDGFDVDFKQQTTSALSRTFGTLGGTQYEKVDMSASLAAGQIHARQESIAINAPGGMGGFGSAFLADSFRHLSGLNPFAWTNATQASFNINIDGNEFIVPGSGEVSLMIYKRGTLDDFIPFCGNTVLFSYHWSIGANAPAVDPCGAPYQGNLSGMVDENLSVTFAPGEDFDWAFGVRVGGAFNANLGEGNTGSGHWLQDFGNTATLTYAGPAGSTVQSGSGVFPGTDPGAAVPEPTTLALLLAAGCALRVSRKRATQH
jgi:hypothetical protein